MYYETEEIVNNTKALLGITDDSKDTILNFIAEDTISAVLAYCRIEVLPYQLVGLIAQISAKSYRINSYGTEEIPSDIKSISEGERSISFESRSGANGIISDYKSRLAPFVNRRAKVPSEV